MFEVVCVCVCVCVCESVCVTCLMPADVDNILDSYHCLGQSHYMDYPVHMPTCSKVVICEAVR